MKNAGAIERCLYEIPPHLGTLREQARTELAGYTETMACGHRKADWVEAEPFLTPEEGETHEAYCKVCREIERAVEAVCVKQPDALLDAHLEETVKERDEAEEAMSQAYFLITGNSPEWSNNFGHEQALQDIDDAQRCMRTEIKNNEQAVAREVAGAYEAAAEMVRTTYLDSVFKTDEKPLKPAQLIERVILAIRSLDSSAAARGKQAIREEALMVADARIATLTSLNVAQGDELRRLRSMPERAWLIERRDYGTEYLSGEAGGYFPTWTSDPLEAIRFSRRADAERIAGIFDDLDIHICDHEWGLIDKP